MSSPNMTNVSIEMTTVNLSTTSAPAEPETAIPWQRIVVATVQYILVFMTVVGNTMVIIAIAIDKRLQTVFNVFIVNLAITDVSIGLIAMNFFAVFNLYGYWPFGEFLCCVWLFGDFGMTFSSIFTLLAISLDRFWSVHWGNHYRVHNNRRKAILATVFIWSSMFILWGPAFIVDRIHHSVPGECFYDPQKNKAFVSAVAILGYHGSTIVMLYCYIKVFVFVRRRSKTGPMGRGHPGPGETTVTKTAVASRASLTTQQNDKSVSDPQRNNVTINVDLDEAEDTQKLTEDGGSASVESLVQRKHLHPNDAMQKQQRNVDGKSEEAMATDPDSELNDSTQNQQSGMTRSNGTAKNQLNQKLTVAEEQAANATRTLRREQKVFLTLSYIVVGYLICWMPFHVSFDVMAFDPTLIPAKFYDVTYWLAYCNSAINPLLYNFSSPEFHKAFKKILGRK